MRTRCMACSIIWRPRFKGLVISRRLSAGNTPEGFENFQYAKLASEHARRRNRLLDLNEEGKYELMPVLDADLHPTPVRLAARLLDPDAFVICSRC